jgi:hypothetical protein
MKNAMFTGLQTGLKCMLFLVLLLAVVSSWASTPGNPETVCSAPSPSKSGQGTGSISFAWSAVSDGATYQVYWVRTENNQTGSVQSTSNTNTTFTGLAAGHYQFYFATNCGTEPSGYVILDEMIYD